MLKIQQLRVSYGGIQALRGIDLEVPDGKIVTLIGANGAGKSTTLRTISGLVKAESGSIQWNGEELLGKPIDKIISAGIAMSPEGRRVFADLTVLENLKLGAYLRKDKAEIEKDLKWVYELFPRLEERNWQSAGTLSGGEQQMLAVGRALMSRPKLMMLDEPSLGLAPLVVQDIFSIIREINRQGVTVLLIEQNANMALKIADLAYVLETGNITMSGTGAELLAFDIPKSRSFMHLDTVFTMVDRDKFTVHPNILQQITVFVMELDENRKMKIRQEDGRLEDILKEHLELDKVTLIPCGQGSEIDAAREQWSDGSNTLAIGPGEVVVYSRNYVTNRALEEAGIRLHTIPSAELSRGRGGPRCMSMPLWREDP